MHKCVSQLSHRRVCVNSYFSFGLVYWSFTTWRILTNASLAARKKSTSCNTKLLDQTIIRQAGRGGLWSHHLEGVEASFIFLRADWGLPGNSFRSISSRGRRVSRPKPRQPSFARSLPGFPDNRDCDEDGIGSWLSIEYWLVVQQSIERGWYDFILYLSGYIVSLLRKGFILLSEVRIWHQRPSIYSSHNLENPTSKFLPPTPSSPRVDLKKVWLCCCRCCLEQKIWFLPQDLRFPRIPLAMFDLVLSKSCLST